MVPIIALILLVAVIVLGMITKKNVGIIAFLAAYLFGTFVVGLKPAAIYADGFPVTVFFLVMSSTFMFAVANINGTTSMIAENVAVLSRGRNKLIPWLFFVVTAFLSGVGGSMLILVIIMPIAYSTCLSRNLNITMTALIVMAGGMIGGLSPIALNGIVASALAAENGVNNYLPMWACYSVSIFLMAVAAYFIFGGWKIPNAADSDKVQYKPFNRDQKVTILAILLICVATIVFGQNIGLVCLACVSVLILFGFCDQKKAIDAIPWSTLILITGMSMLINVIDKAGGIVFLTEKLSGVLNEHTVQPIMIMLGGLMGAVSSGTGVVMPTLIPLAANLAQANPGLDTVAAIAGVVIGTNGVVLSPFSTVGALACGSAPENLNIDKLYRHLIITAVIFIIASAGLSAIGFYNIFF